MDTSTAPRWMIYGANGYTAKLIIDEAKRRGHAGALVLAGRHPQRVLDLSQATGLPARIFDLRNAELAARQLDGIEAVLHCAGPFSATARPMLDACIKAHADYLDITGEIDVFEMVHGRDQELRDAGVSAIPGVGFDVVPTDCLAAMLKEMLPDATQLKLAFDPRGGAFSPGTAKTMIEGLGEGGRIRRDGRIVAVPTAHQSAMISFDGGAAVSAVAIPWGDVSTAFYSTRIPNIEVYLAMPRAQIQALRASGYVRGLFRLPFVQRALKARVERQVKGPSDAHRARERCLLWGEVRNAAGKRRALRARTPEGYTLTAEAAVRAVEHVLGGKVPSGALTPSMAFGADFLRELSGVTIDSV